MMSRRLLAASLLSLPLSLLAACAGRLLDPEQRALDGSVLDAGPDTAPGAEGDGGDEHAAAACSTDAATFPCGDASCVVGTEFCSVTVYYCPEFARTAARRVAEIDRYACMPAPPRCGTCAACSCLVDSGACPYGDECVCSGSQGAVTTTSAAY